MPTWRRENIHISTLQIFPKHVIEFISLGGAASGPAHGGETVISSHAGAAEKLSHMADINRLARSHKDVSIMFMDIVGEQGGPHLCG